MNQDDINYGRLFCVIGITPVFPAEFVIFRVQQKDPRAAAGLSTHQKGLPDADRHQGRPVRLPLLPGDPDQCKHDGVPVSGSFSEVSGLEGPQDPILYRSGR